SRPRRRRSAHRCAQPAWLRARAQALARLPQALRHQRRAALSRSRWLQDRHGHAAGDAVLKAVTMLISRHVRASDVVARLGGDEFAVLLWNLNEADALARARDLETLVAEAAIEQGDARV